VARRRHGAAASVARQESQNSRCCPKDRNPDDLARSGGAARVEEVIAAARGLADVIWSREIEGGIFATPGTPRGAGEADR